MTSGLDQRLQAALGREFEVREEIGRGGWGTVFRAVDRRLGRHVAVKVLLPELAHQVRFRTRFVREAQLSSQLNHPNIVQVHDVGEHEDLVWFLMQFVDGDAIHHHVAVTGALSIMRAARVLQDAALALAFAHERGIVHRDIKPGNILLERASGRALVTDFGIAKALTEIEGLGEAGHSVRRSASHLTATGMVLGTLQYMSPEQAARDVVDHRSDLYSLGLVGYYMISGRHPRSGDELSLFAQALEGTISESVARHPAISEWFGTALERCAAAQADARYSRAEELIEQLAIGIRAQPAHPVARRFVRLVWTGFWVANAGSGVWGILGGPRVDPLLPAALAILMAALLLRVLWQARGEVAWPEIRQALVEERRLWFEERERQFEGDDAVLATMSGVLSLLLGPLDADDSRAILLVIPLVMGLVWFFLFGIWASLAVLGAGVASFGFLRAFGLPEYGDYRARERYRRYQFDKSPNSQPARDVDYWRLPRWIDWLGGRLFRRVPGGGKVAPPSADHAATKVDDVARSTRSAPEASYERLMRAAKSLMTKIRRLAAAVRRHRDVR